MQTLWNQYKLPGYIIDESFIKREHLIDNESSLGDASDKIEDILKYVNHSTDDEVALNGDKLLQEWFPAQKDKNIFISHSHADITLVRGFANFLSSKKSKEPFVDSNLWGDCDNLIQTINSEYNLVSGEENTYYYKDSQRISSNVYLMLITALNKMICQCPIFVFIQSDESVQDGDTYSPWIMNELKTVMNIRETQKRLLKSLKSYLLSGGTGSSELRHANQFESVVPVNKQVTLSYNIGDILDDLTKIDTMEMFNKAFS
ncbi:hypothetical protein X350_06840 [Oenococcus oeni S12]|nr:hypothetical protein X350_06840 [Oenococcus oeni S12]